MYTLLHLMSAVSHLRDSRVHERIIFVHFSCFNVSIRPLDCLLVCVSWRAPQIHLCRDRTCRSRSYLCFQCYRKAETLPTCPSGIFSRTMDRVSQRFKYVLVYGLCVKLNYTTMSPVITCICSKSTTQLLSRLCLLRPLSLRVDLFLGTLSTNAFLPYQCLFSYRSAVEKIHKTWWYYHQRRLQRDFSMTALCVIIRMSQLTCGVTDDSCRKSGFVTDVLNDLSD